MMLAASKMVMLDFNINSNDYKISNDYKNK